MPTLAEIRARLSAAEATKQSKPAADGAIYAHWNIPEGSSATLRFLPDADQSNTFFWAERQIIKLDFPGVLGQDENKKIQIDVPCIEMYDSKLKCPVHEIIRPWFKDSTMEATGRRYWKKRGYIMNGFVVNSPVAEDTTPDNPVRRFVISPQIFALIKASLLDPEMENLPTDYIKGTDFRVNKTSKGGYADYSSSNWARKERALSDAETAAIDQHGLFTLSDYLPKRPDAEHLAAIVEMFEASVAGELYDPARWAKFYKPFGFKETAQTQSTTTGVVLKGTQSVIAEVKRRTEVV